MFNPNEKEYRIPCKECEGGDYIFGSECCGAEMTGDICNECKEHSEREVCAHCGGEGTLIVGRFEFDEYHNWGYYE